MSEPIPNWQSDPSIVARYFDEARIGRDDSAGMHYFHSRPDSRQDLSWLKHFAEVATTGGWSEDIPRIRGILGGLAWWDRAGYGPLNWQESFLKLSTDRFEERCTIYYIGAFFRYDFRFDDLNMVTKAWLRSESVSTPDSLIQAWRAFALLERNEREGVQMLEFALNSPNVSGNSRATCLHALWFARGLEDQADRMLALVETMRREDGPLGSVTLYRQAFAFRMKHQWEKALDAIDNAFNLLSPGPDYLSIHQDFTREREHIVAGQALHRQIEQAQETLDVSVASIKLEITQTVAKTLRTAEERIISEVVTAESRIAESLLNVVTILGVFITIVGFLGASGVLVFKSHFMWWQDIVVLTAGALSAVLFFWLLQWIVSRGLKQALLRHRRHMSSVDPD